MELLNVQDLHKNYGKGKTRQKRLTAFRFPCLKGSRIVLFGRRLKEPPLCRVAPTPTYTVSFVW